MDPKRNLDGKSAADLIAPHSLATTPVTEAAPELWLDSGSGEAPRRRPDLRTLLRFKWLALGVAAAVFVPAGLAVWMMNPPRYEARAAVEVSPIVQRIVYSTDDNGLVPLYQQYLNDQAAVIRSPQVLNRVLERQEVQQTAWYQVEPDPLLGSPPTKLERLREAIDSKVRPQTSFVDVRMESADADEAALIVNAVIDEYLQVVYERSKQLDDAVYQELVDQHTELQQKIDGHRQTIAELRGGLLTATPDELQGQQRQRLDIKQAALEELQQQIKLAEWEREQLQAAIDQQGPALQQAAGQSVRYENDPIWRVLYADLKAAEQQALVTAQRLGEQHPRLLELKNLVEAAAAKLVGREQQIDQLLAQQGTPPPAAADTPASRLKLLDARLDRLRFEERLKAEDLRLERERVQDTTRIAQLLTKEMDDLALAEQRFKDVRERKVAMEVERKAPASIRRQDKAFAPSQPHNSRRRTMLLAVALLGALGCGALCSYLRAMTVPAIQDYGDLTAATHVPLLGHVPLVRRHSNGHAAQAQAIQAECIRMVRTALLERLQDGRNCSIQLTSAGAGAGKTSVAVLLAESLVRCGKRVLLVDADLRNPAIHKRFELKLEPGLLEVLKGDFPLEQARHADAGGLHLLTAGRMRRETDAEVLGSPELSAHLARWLEEYEVVLFDSAPLLPVADAQILSRRLDGSVLVVREAHCKQSEVVDALKQLNAAGGALLGMVFFSRGRGSTYYGEYGYGYGYGYRPGGYDADVALDARDASRA